ncbi:hypothetical protein BO94DRAFT_533162, partial [Aspergillus sclerotioniger CBS 115572]
MKFFAVATLFAATAMAGIVPSEFSWISQTGLTNLNKANAENTCGDNTVMCCTGFTPSTGGFSDSDTVLSKMGRQVPGKVEGGKSCSPCGPDNKGQSVACCTGGSGNLINLPCIAIGSIL